jgi:hypothetical protein
MPSITKNSLRLAGLATLIIASPLAIGLFEPTLPSKLTPSPLLLLLWVLPLFLYGVIRQPLNKVICVIWIGWFLVGMVNIAASYINYGDFYLVDANYPALIYICYATAYFAGMALYERLFIPSRATPHEPRAANTRHHLIQVGGATTHPLVAIVLLVFPFALFLSVYLSVGFIPILLGRNIEAEMYTSNYGYLYGFSAVIVLSMLYVARKYIECSGKTGKAIYLTLLVCMGFVSIMTGKRMSLMIFFAALLAQLTITGGPGSRLDLRRIGKIILIVVAVYIGGQLLRAGGNSSFQTASQRLAAVGVEYRDFAYAVTNFNEQLLTGYSWLSSTLASAINSSLLHALGIEKKELIRLDFGSISKPLFMGGDFGVRTGLVSELFFAYGFFGLGVIFCFGVLTSILSKKLSHSRDKTAIMFLCAVYGLFALALTENSIDVSGTLTVYLYVWLAFVVLAKLPRRGNGGWAGA